MYFIVFILFLLFAATVGTILYTYLRKEQDKITPQNKNVTASLSVITWNEKIIIGILMVFLSLVIIALVKSLLPVPIPHNSIIVGSYHARLLVDDRVPYIFSIEKSRKISSKLPENLEYDPEWSPDGQWIISSVVERVGDGFSESKIYIMRADGSQRTLVPTPHDGLEPTWSPDGKQIAYSARNGGVYIANIGCLLRGETCTPESRLLIKPTHDSNAPSSFPDWSPDGWQIAFVDGKSHVSTISIDGQRPSIDITPNFSGTITKPRWSPDGTKIAAVCDDKRENICLINSNGSNLITLKNDTKYGRIDNPIWSPDGQNIAYISNISNEPYFQMCVDGCSFAYTEAVFIMNTNGSEVTLLYSEDNMSISWITWFP